MNRRVYVVQWEGAEDESVADSVRASGWEVEAGPGDAAAFCEHVSNCLPLAAVVPLEPDPNEACGLGCLLREAGEPPDTPLVFVGGLPESRDIARNLLPGERVLDVDGLLAALEQLSREGAQES